MTHPHLSQGHCPARLLPDKNNVFQNQAEQIVAFRSAATVSLNFRNQFKIKSVKFQVNIQTNLTPNRLILFLFRNC